MARPKVTVVGAGNVGATTAQYIVERELADVVLTDVVEGLPQGKALDLLQAGPVHGYDCRITGANDYEPTAGSDIIVITAGLARKPGMSRDDLLMKNAEIVGGVVAETTRRSPTAILIIVTNPLDAMAQLAFRRSGFPQAARHRHGRRARLGALPDVHRAGARRLGRERHGLRPGRPRGHAWSRSRATRRWPASRSPSSCPRSGSTPS